MSLYGYGFAYATTPAYSFLSPPATLPPQTPSSASANEDPYGNTTPPPTRIRTYSYPPPPPPIYPSYSPSSPPPPPSRPSPPPSSRPSPPPPSPSSPPSSPTHSKPPPPPPPPSPSPPPPSPSPSQPPPPRPSPPPPQSLSPSPPPPPIIFLSPPPRIVYPSPPPPQVQTKPPPSAPPPASYSHTAPVLPFPLSSPPPPPQLPPLTTPPPPQRPPLTTPPPPQLPPLATPPPPQLPPLATPPPPQLPPLATPPPPQLPPLSTPPHPPPTIATPLASNAAGNPPSRMRGSPTTSGSSRGVVGNSATESSSYAGNKGSETMTIASAALVTGVVVLSLLGIVVWSVKKSRRPFVAYPLGYPLPSHYGSSLTSETSYPRSPSDPFYRPGSRRHTVLSSLSERSFGVSQLCFTYEELSEITNGFSSQNLLGEGGFGSVYRGSLPDGREVAVKRLKDGGMQGEREFKAEVEIIGRVHHRHLVSLLGFCISENQRLLVYDYVPNNTLYYHLHVSGEGRPVMDWATRVQVAAGAARGIAYLHEDCHPRIIHRDIKSSNILLDSNSEAQVSDFGLARLTLETCTHVTTRVMGTFGYLAPEYASTGKLTTKSDVYSFGVVLLELITGRKPVDMSQSLGDESLVEWARPLMLKALESGNIEGLPDHRLGNNYKRSEMLCMIEAAASCVRHSAVMRPRMSQVVRALDSLRELDLQNGVRPGQSEIFNSAQHSIEIRHFENSRNDSPKDTSYQSPKRLL